MSVTVESFNRACVKVFGDPEFKARLKALDDEYAASLARLGLTPEDVNEDIAAMQVAFMLKASR